jgi:hypothetical protein
MPIVVALDAVSGIRPVLGLFGVLDGDAAGRCECPERSETRRSRSAVSQGQVEAHLHEVQIAVLWTILHVGEPVVQLHAEVVG